MFQISLRVTTKEKPVVDTHKIKTGESKVCHYGKSSIHKERKQKRKKGRKELQNSQNIINKMAMVSTCLSIITLKVNGLNSLIKRNRVAEWIKIRTQLYAAYRTLTLASRTHIG